MYIMLFSVYLSIYFLGIKIYKLLKCLMESEYPGLVQTFLIAFILIILIFINKYPFFHFIQNKKFEFVFKLKLV